MEKVIWQQGTYWFYIAIILLCFITSYLFSKVEFQRELSIKGTKLDVFVPFCILLFVKGSSICGTDVTTGYKNNFESAVSFAKFGDNSTEFGFRLVNIIVRNITEEYSWYLFVFALITLIPVVFVIEKYRDSIDVPLVVLGYASIYFFQGLSLLRIFAAASFCLLSFSALYEKKYFKAMIWVWVATLFHITSLVMIIPCFIKIFRVSKKLLAVGIVGVIGVLFLGRAQLQVFLTGRYGVYSLADSLEVGTEFIWFYGLLAAVFLILYYFRKNNEKEENAETEMMDLAFIWVLMGIFISLAQYAVPILGRMYVYTIPMLFGIGAEMKYMKEHVPNRYFFFYCIFVLYFLLRYNIYIMGYYETDGIVPYINCFEWII